MASVRSAHQLKGTLQGNSRKTDIHSTDTPKTYELVYRGVQAGPPLAALAQGQTRLPNSSMAVSVAAQLDNQNFDGYKTLVCDLTPNHATAG